MLKISSFIQRFGLVEGLSLYLKFRYGKTDKLEFSNLKFPIYMQPNSIDNSSFQEIFLDQEYEFKFPEFNKNEIVVIDAGANIGFGSVFFMNRFTVSKLVAVEPESENFRWLEKTQKTITK